MFYDDYFRQAQAISVRSCGSGVGDPVIPATELSTFKSQIRGARFQKREELKFAVRSAVAKFGVD